jgi:hypothetical protein
MQATLDELERENAELRKAVLLLQQRLAFFTNHKTIAAGISGETLISRLADGVVTSYAESYDVVDASGRRIEVKYSGLNTPTKQSPTKRWAWAKIFGEGGAKEFDYLILVGERDERWAEHYKDPTNPFVLFSIPFSEVSQLTMGMSGGRHRAIQLTSNPLKARSAAAAMFKRYQVTSAELSAMFGL